MTRWASKLIVLASLSLSFLAGGITSASAYSCEAGFAKADRLIRQAEAAIKPGTDARILAMIAEARGINEAAKISHRKASQRHTKKVGKYMHGDAVRKGRWAQSLAKEAIFLATGEAR